MIVTTATPAQIDAEIARIESAWGTAYTVFEKATKVLDSEHATAARRAQADQALAEVTVTMDALRIEQAPLHAEFNRRGGWTRWYLVDGGHLHYDASSFRCSRTMSTDNYWMTEYSGRPAEDMIELAGERICTVCFPEAPVALRDRPSQLQTKTEAEKAEAAREREDKRSAAARTKAAKAITTADGGQLRDHNGDAINTEAEATRIYRESVTRIITVNDDSFMLNRAPGQSVEEHLAYRDRIIEIEQADVELMLPALAAKHGVTLAEERALHVKAIETKVRKDLREAAKYRAQHPSYFISAEEA